jgi:2-octaprenyl-6-methoxyphenol hydroxylase
VIAGGGPVGLTLALGLAQQGYRVTLLEKVEPKAGAVNSFDGRVLALSEGSRQILQSLGLWPALLAHLTPIKHVHVSQKGYLGLTLIHAEEMNVAALGYSIRAEALGEVLWQAVRAQANIDIRCPAQLLGFVQDEEDVYVDVEQLGQRVSVRAKLLLGADGTDSQVRRGLNWRLVHKSYHAWAILAQVDTFEPHENWAFERFTAQGPVALLPLSSHSHKLVYVASDEEYADLLALSDEAFIAAFSRKMGERFGGYHRLSGRVAYPLTESYVERVAQGRAVLLGNASHTQHPVAAQGLNLGLRDVASLLAGLQIQGVDDVSWLAGYERERQQDHRQVMGLTDGLIRVFEHPSPFVGHLRGVAMMALQAMPGLKRRLARFSMRGAQS